MISQNNSTKINKQINVDKINKLINDHHLSMKQIPKQLIEEINLLIRSWNFKEREILKINNKIIELKKKLLDPQYDKIYTKNEIKNLKDKKSEFNIGEESKKILNKIIEIHEVLNSNNIYSLVQQIKIRNKKHIYDCCFNCKYQSEFMLMIIEIIINQLKIKPKLLSQDEKEKIKKEYIFGK